MVIEQTFLIFLVIPVFFFLVLIFNTLFKKNICAVCGGIFLTWILFLVLHYLGYFQNQIILALLIGGTVSGVFNLLKSKLGLFKLPFILTLFYLGYLLLTKSFNLYIIYLLLSFWLIFGLIYILLKNKNFLQKLIECCKDW